jgi:hypothetical protein
MEKSLIIAKERYLPPLSPARGDLHAARHLVYKVDEIATLSGGWRRLSCN